MCIAILNKAEKITLSEFRNSLESNSDGFGMAYVIGGKIQVWKSLSNNSKKLYNEYSKVYEKSESPIILHFRISTGGGINLDNCHPFHISKNVVFAHNGIIKGYGTKLENDTRHFSREILELIPEADLFNNTAIQTLIENIIGYSKLVFLNSKGEYKIYGEDLGHWSQNGNWFSNESYKACEVDTLPYWKDWCLDKNTQTWKKAGTVKTPKIEPEKLYYCEGCGQQKKKLSFLSAFNVWACNECKVWYGENWEN